MDLDLEEFKMAVFIRDDVEFAGYRILSHVTGELAFKVMPKLTNIEIHIPSWECPEDFVVGNFVTSNN